MKNLVKFKATAFIGPNTAVGSSGGKTVRARIPVNKRPAVGEEVELNEDEVSKATELDIEKADAVLEQEKAIKKTINSNALAAPGAVPTVSSSPSKK